MKLSQKSIQQCCIGHFVTIGTSSDGQIHVNIFFESTYRCKIDIHFPPNYEGDKRAIFCAVLDRINTGGLLSIRMDYENIRYVFSMEELSAMERMFKFFTFHVYEVPADLLPEQQSVKIDIRKIRNTIRRQEDRERRILLKNQPVSSANH